MLGNIADKLESVPFRVRDPELIPAQRYYDEEFFILENELLWPHVWQMACRLEEIPNAGDFVEYTFLDKSVLVVRSKDGIKAFHNTCRHRGLRLAEGRGNCAKQGFICPFHGWRWNSEGKNTFVFGPGLFSERLLDPAEIALVPCRVETWGGCAFINLDDDAPSLLDCLGPAAQRLDALGMSNLKTEWWYGTVLPTNWKLAMEAFMEGYHVMKTHPQLHSVTPPGSDYGSDPAGTVRPYTGSARDYIKTTAAMYRVISDGMAGLCHPREAAIAEELTEMELPDDLGEAAALYYKRLREEIVNRSRAQGMVVPDLNEVAATQPFHAVEFLFPHYFLLPVFSAMASYRIRPLTPETCLFEIWSLAPFPEGAERERPLEPVMLPYDSPDFPLIPQQDYSNLPRQQLGLHGQGFNFMRLSKAVEGMVSNYQRLIDGYLAGMAPEKLAKASQIVGSGFDAPVLDLGISPNS